VKGPSCVTRSCGSVDGESRGVFGLSDWIAGDSREKKRRSGGLGVGRQALWAMDGGSSGLGG